jgi:glycosidase
MEPRFGTEDDLKELAAELQKRDMRVILDMVLNHVAPESKRVQQTPDWFHGKGGITDWNDPVQLTTHDVHGLPDLNQNNPEVYQYLIKSSEKWIDVLKPAGFRLDAVKHMPNDFWAKYNAHIRAYAGGDFVMLGEDLNGNPAEVAKTATDGQFNAIFDFPLHFAMIDVFCKDQNVGRLASVLSADAMYPAAVRDRGLVTLLDNHDLPRVMAACNNDRIRVRDALTFMSAVRGVPSFTWGTEIGMAGAKEPENRETMNFEADQVFGPAIRDAHQRRAKNPALTQGQSWIAQMEKDLLVIVRLHETQTGIIMVNRGIGLKKVTVPSELGLGEVVLEAPAGTVSLEFLDGSPNLQTLTKSLQQPQSVQVEFLATELPIELGDRVFVVGSDPKLGNWNPDDAPEMSPASPEGNVWKVSVPLTRSSAYAYKFVRKKADGTVVWEDGPNRYIFAKQ